MLPEKLSNGLCSLKPHVERLCMVCEMTVSSGGELSSSQFYPAVMRSHARFTYSKVAAILNVKENQSNGIDAKEISDITGLPLNVLGQLSNIRIYDQDTQPCNNIVQFDEYK